MHNIRENLFLSFVYNAAGVPIAAGILYPWFGMLLSPIIAGAAMALGMVLLIHVPVAAAAVGAVAYAVVLVLVERTIHPEGLRLAQQVVRRRLPRRMRSADT